MFFVNEAIISSNGTATVNSAAINAAQTFKASLQAVTTGTVVGTIKLQGSNDVPPAGNQNMGFVPTNWSDLGSATNITTGGGVFLVAQQDICSMYIRAVFTFTSGTGSLVVNIKTLGY
jgi:hypothetical protein